MKKNKGFTLVELLAVIVILAIIMIIAIPSVLNTMQTAKKKSMVNFAEKVLNELSKTYVSKMSFEGYIRPAQRTYYVFDIKKDLGMTNTGDYFGLATVEEFYDDINNKEVTNYEINLFSNEYILAYSSNPESSENALDVEHIHDINELLGLMKNMELNIGLSEFRKLPLKEILVAANLDGECIYYNMAFVDGAENRQMWCTQIADRNKERFEECKAHETPLEYKRAMRIADYLDDNILTTPTC